MPCTVCNECKNDILECSFYSSFDYYYDICDKCLESKKFHFKWSEKTNYTECSICLRDLIKKSLWENDAFPLCEQCYDKEKIYNFIKNKFSYFNYNNKDDYIFVDSVFRTSFYNAKTPLSLENTEDLIKPIKDIIKYKDESTHCLISNLIAVDIKSSIFDWRIFTEFTKFNLIDFVTCFLINTNKDSCEFRNIAIVISDDHGRHRIFNVFNDVQHFREEYDKFKLNTKVYVIKEEERCEFTELVYCKEENYEEIMSYIDDFGYYYTLKYDLPYEHG